MTISSALQHESPPSDRIRSHPPGWDLVWSLWPVFKPMKHRIPPKFHGPLCALGFLAIIALVALIESIGGAN